MSDIQVPNGLEVNEAIDGANDLMHIYQPGSGGVRRNKKGLLDTFKEFFLPDDFMDIILTEYLTTTVPAIAADSQVKINGVYYTNPLEIVISGATSNGVWYDILLTPSGTTFTASFIARGTGVWSDSKKGLYDGNNRVVAAVYKDGSGNFINKNVLVIVNRNTEIKIEIGLWNMDTANSHAVNHGLSDETKITRLDTTIYSNAGAAFSLLYLGTGASGDISGGYGGITSTQISLVRQTGRLFDLAAFNAATGRITMGYEV